MSKTPPIPGGVKHKKTLDTDSVHIQRSEAQHRTYCGPPCTKSRTGGIIRTAMCRLFGCVWSLALRMQEVSAANTCFCIALFVPYKGNYTAFWRIVKGDLAVSGKKHDISGQFGNGKTGAFLLSKTDILNRCGSGWQKPVDSVSPFSFYKLYYYLCYSHISKNLF